MKEIKALNNNVLVRRIEKQAAEETRGGIIVPVDTSAASPTEEVEVVHVSPDIALPEGKKPSVKKGDRVLIHRGLNGTPITLGTQKYLMVGYVSLICKVEESPRG